MMNSNNPSGPSKSGSALQKLASNNPHALAGSSGRMGSFRSRPARGTHASHPVSAHQHQDIFQEAWQTDSRAIPDWTSEFSSGPGIGTNTAHLNTQTNPSGFCLNGKSANSTGTSSYHHHYYNQRFGPPSTPIQLDPNEFILANRHSVAESSRQSQLIMKNENHPFNMKGFDEIFDEIISSTQKNPQSSSQAREIGRINAQEFQNWIDRRDLMQAATFNSFAPQASMSSSLMANGVGGNSANSQSPLQSAWNDAQIEAAFDRFSQSDFLTNQKKDDPSISWEEQFNIGNSEKTSSSQIYSTDGDLLNPASSSRQQQQQQHPPRYHFEPNNPFLKHPDPWSLGLKLLNDEKFVNAHSLSVIALVFEAAIQLYSSEQQPSYAHSASAFGSGRESAARKPPESFNLSMAWAKLGLIQAENEKEPAAILALLNSVHHDGSNWEAWKALAVSFTNEARDREAFLALDKWLTGCCLNGSTHNSVQLDQLALYELYEYLIGKFEQIFGRSSTSNAYGDGLVDIEAAAERLISNQTSNNQPPADIMVGLGLLYYNVGRYSDSVRAFETACRLSGGTDYRLWNRLGATLANSGQSDRAIQAYLKALEIRPGFVRARYNLGVSCMNIGLYSQACQHFLQALSLHNQPNDISPANTSNHHSKHSQEASQSSTPVEDGIPEQSNTSSSPTNHHEQNISFNLWESLQRCLYLMDKPDLAKMATPGSDLRVFRRQFEF